MKTRRMFLWPLLLLGLLVVRASTAQDVMPAPSMMHINQEVGSARVLQLQVGQNRLLVLSEPIGRVHVADPTVADLKVVTQQQMLLTAKSVGDTDLTIWNKDESPLVIALQVTANVTSIQNQLNQLFPQERIQVSSTGDMLVLTGEVSDVRLPKRILEVAQLHSQKVANLIRVTGGQQVQLEVKFAEVSRSGLKEMGLNLFHKGWNYSTNGGVFSSRTPAGQMLESTSPLGAFGGQPPEIARQTFGDAFSFFFSYANPVFPFSVMLNLLESNGLARTLAEPTLVALSGQEAKFLAGGEFPVPITQSLGSVSVQWKKFGVILKFTPTVIDNDSIHLKVFTEVSDIDPGASITLGGATIPGLTSRQGETTVRLADGQSFAIAGLLSDKVRSELDRVPGLGQVPILGALFRSTQWKREETELLVTVTARLARPVSPHQMPPLPGDKEDYDVGSFNLFLMGWDSAERLPGKRQDEEAGDTLSRQRGPSGQVGYVH